MDPKITELMAEVKALPKKTQEFIYNKLWEEVGILLCEIEHCESPIEQLLALALSEKAHIIKKFARDYYIETQTEIGEINKIYRVDFSIEVIDKNDKAHDFVIECDGHDYHEKTKEQARRDKSRDRYLQRKGYTVIRFTGSEIYEDPYSCAKEVISIICRKIIGI